MSLIGKWRWKLLNSSSDQWFEVVKARYGSAAISDLNAKDSSGSSRSSGWWRAVCSIGKIKMQQQQVQVDWFLEGISKRMGNGNSIRFWEDIWLGTCSLRVSFPRLYMISEQKSLTVNQMGSWLDQNWMWNLLWRRRMLVWEEEQLSNLNNLLLSVSPEQDNQDKWVWSFDNSGCYSSKSAYQRLVYTQSPYQTSNTDLEEALKVVWKSLAPSKVNIFTWQLFLGRIPTKYNLVRRNLAHLLSDQLCVLCSVQEENCSHLFLSCNFTGQLWQDISGWIGIQFCTPTNICLSLLQLRGLVRSRNHKLVVSLIWLSVIWSLWKLRNECTFNQGASSIIGILHQVKIRSFKWCKAKANSNCLLFSDWCQDPLSCANFLT